jgi:hypothetical protein
MSERQKLFLSLVFSVTGLVFLLHVYPSCLAIALIVIGYGATVISIREWYEHKSSTPKHWDLPNPEPSGIEDEQLADYLLSIEFDEFTSDIFLDLNIGDRTCKFNANSPYIRCAVNPGVDTCEGCRHYESTSPDVEGSKRS